jgi:hypothetical protein
MKLKDIIEKIVIIGNRIEFGDYCEEINPELVARIREIKNINNLGRGETGSIVQNISDLEVVDNNSKPRNQYESRIIRFRSEGKSFTLAREGKPEGIYTHEWDKFNRRNRHEPRYDLIFLVDYVLATYPKLTLEMYIEEIKGISQNKSSEDIILKLNKNIPENLRLLLTLEK